VSPQRVANLFSVAERRAEAMNFHRVAERPEDIGYWSDRVRELTDLLHDTVHAPEGSI
jgi:hypothetical protein